MRRIVAIDWSGARTRAEDRIRLAEARRRADGSVEVVRLEGGRTRDEVIDHLIGDAERDPDMVVGLDFAFAFPAWFAQDRAWSEPAEVWRAVRDQGEAWLAACPAPFWGRPGRRRPELPAHFRRTEETVGAVGGIRPKSVFQIGGAGAVGTGSIRGMPHLLRLRDAGWRVWPYDPAARGRPLVVEIWPRVLTGPVRKSRRADRMEWLDRCDARVSPDLRARAAESEDAFDALASAVAMVRGGLARAAPVAPTDPTCRIEGAIWSPSD